MADNMRQVAEASEKYSREMEQNRVLEEKLTQSMSSFTELERLHQSVRGELEERNLSMSVLQTRVDKQVKQMQLQSMQIEDLKESVALKITVADDLQNILKQS